MEFVTSRDGTRIAYERCGSGPPVVLVGGAFNDRHTPQTGTATAEFQSGGACAGACGVFRP